MSKFKVGDRVAGPHGNGTLVTVTRVEGLVRYDIWRDGHGVDQDEWWHSTKELALTAMPTLDNLSVDDVVVDDDGDEYTVASVNGRVIYLEGRDGHLYLVATIKELKDNDYTVKGAEADNVEITIEEIAKLKGVDASRIRVKDNK